jgi:hypothetical protein
LQLVPELLAEGTHGPGGTGHGVAE